MIRPFRHAVIMRRPFRRGFRRPIRRAGSLLGLLGMAAVGYTLLEKHQREQARTSEEPPIIWEDDEGLPDLN